MTQKRVNSSSISTRSLARQREIRSRSFPTGRRAPRRSSVALVAGEEPVEDVLAAHRAGSPRLRDGESLVQRPDRVVDVHRLDELVRLLRGAALKRSMQRRRAELGEPGADRVVVPELVEMLDARVNTS